METDKSKSKRHIRLPFDNQGNSGDWGGWIYRHRAGLMVTVIVYLIGTIMFLSYRIVINDAQQQMIALELQKEEIAPPEPTPEQLKQQEQERQELEHEERVQNKVSDANSKLNSELKDAKRSDASEIYKEAERITKELAQGREAYEKGMQQAEAAGSRKSTPKQTKDDASKRQEDEKGNQRTNVPGAVTIEYDLKDRHDVYLHRPTYQCQYGGTVVVDITVNRNGKVISASERSVQATQDDGCIGKMGVQSALASKFNASQGAPEKQKGTITYKFIAQ